MAELAAVILVITEGAEMIDSVFSALQTTKDFFDSFKPQRNYIAEFTRIVEQAKADIIQEMDEIEWTRNNVTMLGRATVWYEDMLPVLQAVPITRQSLRVDGGKGGVPGTYFQVFVNIADSIQDMREIVRWIQIRKSGLIIEPEVFALLLFATCLRNNFIITNTAFKGVLDTGTPVLLPSEIDCTTDVITMVEKWVKDYKQRRAGRIRFRLNRDAEFPPADHHSDDFVPDWQLPYRTWTMTDSSGGDSVMGRIPTQSVGYPLPAPRDVINQKWEKEDIGKTLVPNLLSKLKDSNRLALVGLSKRLVDFRAIANRPV